MNKSNYKVRTVSCQNCFLCGCSGKSLYRELEDRLFGVPGKWNLAKCSNSECALIWLDPMPIPDDLSKLYANYFTHSDTVQRSSLARSLYKRAIDHYISQKFGYPIKRKGILDNLLSTLLRLHPGRWADADALVMHLPSKPRGRLLEIGFGSGETLKRLQDLGWDVEGIDFDPAAVANARGKGLKVYHADLSSEIFPESSFDAVVSSHVIEHVPDPKRYMNFCNRVLKPGGKLIVLTPNAGSVGHRFFKSDWNPLDPPRHLHLFPPAALMKLADNANFSNINCSSTFRGGGFLLASLELRKKRKYNKIKPINNRILIELFYFIEWMICKFDSSAGGELLLTATKQETVEYSQSIISG